MISVTVKDFGPIIEGSVELKPLTVFIGPNNSGKSHLATLVYALMLQGGIPHATCIAYRTKGQLEDQGSPVFYDLAQEDANR